MIIISYDGEYGARVYYNLNDIEFSFITDNEDLIKIIKEIEEEKQKILKN